MMMPRLDVGDLEHEKGVILNEIARAEDMPTSYARRLMMQTYFGDHPLGNPVLGTPESIRAMSLEQMRDYWQRRYIANNLVFSVAGNFDWHQLIALVEAGCGTWTSGPAERVVTAYEPPHPASAVFVRPHLKQQTLLLTMPMIAANDPNYHAAHLASSILGRSDGSRLYWNIYKKGLAQSATSGLWTFQGTGVLFLTALTTPENAPHVLTLLRTEIAQLLANGIAEEEVSRARNKRISALVFSNESTYDRMYRLATDWMDTGRLFSVEEDIARVEQVTSGDIMRVLRRFPLLDKQVLTTLGPLDENALSVKW